MFDPYLIVCTAQQRILFLQKSLRRYMIEVGAFSPTICMYFREGRSQWIERRADRNIASNGLVWPVDRKASGIGSAGWW